MEIIGAYNEKGRLDVSVLKSNLESHLGIDTSNIGTTLPTGTITLDGIDFYINTDEEVIEGTGVANGSWNAEKGVNSPELFEGMTAVYWDNSGNEIELTEASSEEEWNNWYDYNGDGDGQNKWANAVTKDENGNITGYWVWIPRYAYKIESGLFTSTAGTISIKFLQNTSDLDSEGNTISRNYAYSGNAMTDFVVHPAFRDGTSNNFMNGEWDEEVTGFWVAKYEAGFQANTITDNNGVLSTAISNADDEVVYSDLKYTSYNSDTPGTNALNQDLSATGYSNQNLSYPIFLPLTYTYNNICVGDGYVLSQAIDTASNFYGLNSNQTDSHMMKNSEWGAVAYLTQSSYGRNGIEITINNYCNPEENLYRRSITGLSGDTADAASTSEINNIYAYNTVNGFFASTTGNITGIYDLSGGGAEQIAGYIQNGLLYNIGSYSTSNTIDGTSGILLGKTSQANPLAYLTESTRNYTVYPYNVENDSTLENKILYRELLSSVYGYGDSFVEVGSISNRGWNTDDNTFAFTDPFFYRGQRYDNSDAAGVFSCNSGAGGAGSITLRAILISE